MLSPHLLYKCQKIASAWKGGEIPPAISELLQSDPAVRYVHFFVAGDDVFRDNQERRFPLYEENAEEQTCKALIPIIDRDEVVAVFNIVFSLQKAFFDSDTHRLEWLCFAFNRKPRKIIVRKGTRWGDIELHQTSSTCVNNYRPDGATIYMDRVLQYMSDYTMDEFIKTHFEERIRKLRNNGIKEIDETFALDYPLFKMRVRKTDLPKISHSQDSDGVWWVDCPADYDFSKENMQLYLLNYFKKVLFSAAEAYFPERVRKWGIQIYPGRRFEQIEYKSLSRAYACNTGAEKLTFDPKLMAYPAKFTDYVIIHELCHDWIMNHGGGFKAMERKWCQILLKQEPDHYDEFLSTHRFVLFAENPFKAN